jgi:hypothetical protein
MAPQIRTKVEKRKGGEGRRRMVLAGIRGDASKGKADRGAGA